MNLPPGAPPWLRDLAAIPPGVWYTGGFLAGALVTLVYIFAH